MKNIKRWVGIALLLLCGLCSFLPEMIAGTIGLIGLVLVITSFKKPKKEDAAPEPIVMPEPSTRGAMHRFPVVGTKYENEEGKSITKILKLAPREILKDWGEPLYGGQKQDELYGTEYADIYGDYEFDGKLVRTKFNDEDAIKVYLTNSLDEWHIGWIPKDRIEECLEAMQCDAINVSIDIDGGKRMYCDNIKDYNWYVNVEFYK